MCVGAPAVSLTTLNVVLMVLTFLEPFRSLFYLTNTVEICDAKKKRYILGHEHMIVPFAFLFFGVC